MRASRLGRAEVGVREREASTSGCWRVGRLRAKLSWERPEHEGQLSSPLCLHAQSGPAQRAPDTGLLKVQWEELGRGLRGNWLGKVGVRMGVLWTRVSKGNFAWSPEVGRGGTHLLLASESEWDQSTWMGALCSLRISCCGLQVRGPCGTHELLEGLLLSRYRPGSDPGGDSLVMSCGGRPKCGIGGLLCAIGQHLPFHPGGSDLGGD